MKFKISTFKAKSMQVKQFIGQPSINPIQDGGQKVVGDVMHNRNEDANTFAAIIKISAMLKQPWKMY